MRDLTAQVTSSLLQFPEATLRELTEDEVTRGSVLYGKFSGGRSDLAWLARGPHLEVVNCVTGERLSAWHFRGRYEQPPTVRAVKEFSWERKTGLLVGLEEAEGSALCLYDLGVARVVKAIVLPGRVTAVEPIANYGGPSVYTQHLHQSLRWLFGVVAVATDIGHLFLVDVCLDSFSWIPNEIKALDLEFVTAFPDEVAQRRETAIREGRHLCFQLQNPLGTAISTLRYIHRTNQLVVGFSDGCLSLWNMEKLKREHHCQLEGGRIPVYAVTFQEPEKDPNNRCYLWAVQSTQESGSGVLSLHLLQLTFGHVKLLASGQVTYEGLEGCQERFSLDLAGGILPLSRQTSNMKLLSCQTIEGFEDDVDREGSAKEVMSPYVSVSIFSWQVNTCGQEKPSTYLGVFDINCWYNAQMPNSLRPEEFLPNCPYFALWSLDTATSMAAPSPLLDILVHQPSLTWGARPARLPPEQLFNASSYNFDAVCLLSSGVVHITCTGFQKEEEQLEAMVSAAVETGSFQLLMGCIKHWASEKQPNSAENLQFVWDCAWNKVVYTKYEFDQICAPLFDGSCKFIEPITLQSLRDCQRVLSNLSTVLNCIRREERELPEKGFADLTIKQLLATNYSFYAKVVIGQLVYPEGSDEATLSSTPFYSDPLLQTFYTGQQQKPKHLSRGKWHSGCLKISDFVSLLGDQVMKLWQRDEGGTGKYPPPNLHNDRNPRLREAAAATTSIPEHSGKVLPRVQRKLAVERAKPYSCPSWLLREGPKPLQTAIRQARGRNVCVRATTTSNRLSKAGKARMGDKQTKRLPQ